MPFVTGQEANNSSGSATSTTIAATLAGVTAGNLLWLSVGCFNSSTSITISDSTGNSWSAGPTISNGTDPWQHRLFYCANASAGSHTVTATFGTAVAYRCIYIQERSGLATSSPLEGAGTSNRQASGSGTSRNAGTYSNTASVELVAFGYDWNWVSSPTAGAGYTGRTAVWNFNSEAGSTTAIAADAAFTTGGSRSALFTMSNTALSYCLQMAFLVASGGSVNTQTLSDTTVIGDEGLRYVFRNRLAEDAIVASDGLLSQAIYRRLGDDLLTIIDEAIATYLPAGGTTYAQTLSDTLVISDGLIAYLLRNRLADDSLVVTDPTVVSSTEYNYIAESSVDVADAEFHWLRRFRLLEESLTLVDELIAALVAQAQVRTLTDTLTIGDELLAVRYQTVVASDSLTIIDALLSGVVRQVLTLDAIDITDSAILQRHLTRQLEDAIEIDDAVTRVFNLRRILTDDLALTDSATATKTGYVAFYGTTRAAVGMQGNPVAVGLAASANIIGIAA